jgi:hypothetical protein
MSLKVTIAAVKQARDAYRNAQNPKEKAHYRQVLLKRANVLRKRLMTAKRKAALVPPVFGPLTGAGEAAGHEAGREALRQIEAQLARIDTALQDPSVSTDTKAQLTQARGVLLGRRLAALSGSKGVTKPARLGGGAQIRPRVVLEMPAAPVFPSKGQTVVLLDTIAEKVTPEPGENKEVHRLRLWSLLRRALVRLTRRLSSRQPPTTAMMAEIADETIAADLAIASADAAQGGVDGSDQAANAVEFLVMDAQDELDAHADFAADLPMSDLEVDMLLLDAESDDAVLATGVQVDEIAVPSQEDEGVIWRHRYVILGATVAVAAGWLFFGRRN